MCELFGMSSRYPTTVNFSLREFENHWKKPKRKADGWGLAMAQGKDFQIVKEPKPAGKSETLHYFENNKTRSSTVISHLRRAGPSGAVRNFVNTQPFLKELYGRKFVFAHNGVIKRIFHQKQFRLTEIFPIGQTDSEYAFCYLLERIHEELGPRLIGDVNLMKEVLNLYARTINELGTFNFLLSDSDNLYAFRSDKLQVAEQNCICFYGSLKGGPLSIRMGPPCRSKNQNVNLIATIPLTDDDCWHPLPEKEVIVFQKGRRL